MASPILRVRRSVPAVVAARLRADAPLAVVDLAVVAAAYLVPMVVRFEGRVPDGYWVSFQGFVLLAGLLHLSVNYAFGLYGQVWRYASVQEARRIAIAGGLSAALVIGSVLWFDRPVPLSVGCFGAMLALAGFGAVRFQSRLFALRRQEVVPPKRDRVLVIGADTGEAIVRDILRDPASGLFPVAFLDDDRRKHGLAIHGIPVVGTADDLADVLPRWHIERVLIALPSVPSDLMRHIVEVCESADVAVLVLPTLDEIIGGRVSVRDIRDVRIEDLIGRKLVETDLGAVAQLLQGRRVLVTGAGGSIGSEIVRQVLPFRPSALLVLDNDETHLHDVLTELDVPDGVRLVPLLADIRDGRRIEALIGAERPEIVFHAAAHKHVPMLELHPAEGIKTNVLGTVNVAEAAVRSGAERFVLISTDKAIEPVSVMGATKYLAERAIRSMSGRGCMFSSVRFGNVVGSRGSVVPTFIRQIAHGGPVTVTDPRMTRYFMSISEAVQLVLQAAALAEGGDVFTLDMGEPVNILALARRMVRMAGKSPDVDVRIEITGARPGERLTEQIVSPAEHSSPTTNPYVFRSIPTKLSPAQARIEIQGVTKLAAIEDPAQIRIILHEIVGGAHVGPPSHLTGVAVGSVPAGS